MKSKSVKMALVGFVVIAGALIWKLQMSPFQKALPLEWVENTFPESVDTEDSDWSVLPYGYTLAPWPKSFQGEPIVTKLTYHQGPPQKFLQELTQIWRPVEVELRIDGPRTVVQNKSALEWKKCFESHFTCSREKRLVEEYLEIKGRETPKLTWFETLDMLGPRGVHTVQDYPSYQTHRFTVITDKGVFQTFTLKMIKNPIGESALSIFLKVLGGMKVKDDLESSRVWIQNKIQSVRLEQVKANPNPKLRIEKYIEVQNLIASHLSVDPAEFAPYFHLAGVTHLLGTALFKSTETYFGNQESWTLNIKPMLEALVHYARDFQTQKPSEQSKAQVQNLEALLQDILLLQERMAKGQNLKR